MVLGLVLPTVMPPGPSHRCVGRHFVLLAPASLNGLDVALNVPFVIKPPEGHFGALNLRLVHPCKSFWEVD